MTRNEPEILAEVERVLTSELNRAGAVRPDQDLLNDLQLDSLSLLTLVVSLEDKFQVALREEDAPGVRTVGDLVSLVARRIAETEVV